MARIKDRPQDPNIDLLDRFDRTRTADDSDVGHTAQDLINFINNNITTANAEIAASAETTLNNAGDFFDFDVSALTPPVSGRQVIPVVLEKGTAGGELFGQTRVLEYTTPSSGVLSSVVRVGNTNIAYCMKRKQDGLYKLDLANKTVNLVQTGLPYQAFTGVYDSISNKILFTNDASNLGGTASTCTILDLETGIATGYSYAGTAANHDCTSVTVDNLGNGYLIPYYPGTRSNAIVKVDLKPSAPVFSVLKNLTGLPNVAYVGNPVIYNSNIYLFPYGAGSFSFPIKKVNINTGGITSIGISRLGYEMDGFIIGKFIYCSPPRSADILEFNVETETVTLYPIPGGYGGTYNWLGGRLLNNKYYIFPSGTRSGIVEFDIATKNIRVLGNLSNITAGAVYNNTLVQGVRTNKFTELSFDNFVSPAAPAPFESANNIFDTGGNVNRLASLEDYDVDFTEDGNGNITNVRVTMLTEGSKNVTLNLVYSGF